MQKECDSYQGFHQDIAHVSDVTYLAQSGNPTDGLPCNMDFAMDQKVEWEGLYADRVRTNWCFGTNGGWP